ncbi:hypothetical protein LSTR_LSTR001786 [Laodelphax striatellus]|uniref:PHR domain-containing protein n=1 Tax=Laodelphax striatellus TaxID=195883 RepID=A0A482WGA1_LAOST|nr:hypothetical protein LSTR_LSTR001786 [Laodelphax striatellus]
MFPEPDRIGKHFHELFKILPDQQKKKIEWKKNKKGKVTKNKEKRKPKVDGGGGAEVCAAPDVELATNASAFAVFASVRLAVLERWMKDACDLHLAASSCSSAAATPLDSDAEDASERCQSVTTRVPKIVGVGLRSVFELVRESRTSNPEFCTKALRALLDILQGQQPEGLKGEPAQVTEPLFDLLLDLATTSQEATAGSSSSAANDGRHLTAVACACLLSLVAAYGDTGHLLRAVAALLMCPRPLAQQNIAMPTVLASLQRSVHGVLLGKTIRPDWMTCGTPKSCLLMTYKVKIPIDEGAGYRNKALASDGKFLYLHNSHGLFKIGSGYGGSIKGHVYLHRPEFYPDKKGWLGYSQGILYYRCLGLNDLIAIETDELTVQSVSKIEKSCDGVMFSDGESLGVITSAKDVLFSGKSSSLGMKSGGAGGGRWTELSVPKSPRIVEVAAGHDGAHAVLLADDGAVYFTGTARRGEDGDQNKVRRQPKAGKPKKISKLDGQVIVNAACNNGTTALVTKDGELIMYGKDTTHCDPSTGVVTDLKDIHVSQVSLGKAHAVVVSNKGHLYTFGINNKGQCGRDFTTQIKEASVIAMETGAAGDEEGFVGGGGEGGVGEEAEEGWGSVEGVMCAPGTHRWKHELCMVCTVCRECTGYSISCLSSMRSDRNPGQECGCGEGDSGCAECGCCRICGRENVDNSELAILGPSGAGDIAGMMRLDLIFGGRQGARIQDHLQRRLDERKQRQRGKLIVGAKATPSSSSSSMHQTPVKSHPSHPRTAPSLQPSSSNTGEDIAGGSDVERETTRVSSLPPARVYLPTESPVIQIASGLHHTIVLTQSGEVFAFGSNSHGQLGVGDVSARAGPVQVRLPAAAGQATHVAAGSNHSVVLFARGDVWTFGSHQKNQLGRNQSKEGGGTAKDWFSLPGPIPQVGPRHGRRATWVGASADQTYLKLDESLINSNSLKHSSLMANKHCIVLLPTECLESKSFKCLVINKRDGNCNSFSGPLQVDFTHAATCLDPYYDVLWSFVETEDGLGGEVSCYNVICAEAKSSDILRAELAVPGVSGVFVRRSHAALHLLAALDTLVARHHLPHAAAHASALPAAAVAQLRHHDHKAAAAAAAATAAYSSEDFSSVTRFESHGGGWGYSGHSIEAIRFMADTDIMLGGFGLFGGRGEYTGKIKLFDIGMEGGEQESDGEMLAETDEAPYECGPRQKYPMLFEEPVLLQANKWYVAWARVSGPSSDCGSGGQGMVTTEDQVVFYFKSSKKSNNGTDVNAGQIPQLLYRVVAVDQQGSGAGGGVGGGPGGGGDCLEPVHPLSRDFSRHVTGHCFQSLLALLQWAWNAYRAALTEIGHNSVGISLQIAQMELESLVYICRASLRLIRTYVNEIYPGQASAVHARVTETSQLAESIGDVRALLRQILLDAVPTLPFRHAKQKKTQSAQIALYTKMTKEILDECHETFVASFHAFYPTAFLKWTSLCNLLASMDKEGESAGSSDRLASAVVAALCSRSIRLRSTFPILTSSDNADQLKTDATSAAIPMMPCLDSHYYPLLVEHMTYRSQTEDASTGAGVWQFREVLDRLLDVVTLSVRQALCLEKMSHSAELVHNCCHLLVRVIAELASQASGIDEEMEGACGRVLQSSPARFSRTNGSRTWNTGNGSPDAICFSVDRPGVAIAGAAVYGGAGSYDYELELLDDANTPNNPGNDPSHAQRWNSLQLTRGVFGIEDCLSDDIVELKFDYPVFIKENVKYAIRLRNHGGRTSNGDGGLSSVRGPDGVTFSFSTCSLSFNGTTQTRGQIPYLLYYSNPSESDSGGGGSGGGGGCRNKAVLEVGARKMALQMAAAVTGRCARLLELARQRAAAVDDQQPDVSRLLATATLVTTLLPLTLAHISSLATSDPKSGVQVLGLIQDLLPHVAALNLLGGGGSLARSSSTVDSAGCHDPSSTTSHYYAWVESDHPYKPASVSNYRVVFPETVRWMALEFAPECGTAQAEDSLQLYIPATAAFPTAAAAADDFLPYWPVLHRFSNQWPQSAIVLPGNEAMFSLETASDYVKDDKACQFGFRCQVIGYEWPVDAHDGLRLLEMELAFLGGMCAASLIKNDLVLPVSSYEFEEDMENVEDIARQIFAKHSSLLSKGFALASPPTVSQALDGVLPFR